MTPFLHSAGRNVSIGSGVGPTGGCADTALAETVWKLHGLLVRPRSAEADARSAKRRLLQVLQATKERPLPQMFVAPLALPGGQKEGERGATPLRQATHSGPRSTAPRRHSRTHSALSRRDRPARAQSSAAGDVAMAEEPGSRPRNLFPNDEYHERNPKGASGVASSPQRQRDAAIRRQGARGASARWNGCAGQHAKTGGKDGQMRSKAGKNWQRGGGGRQTRTSASSEARVPIASRAGDLLECEALKRVEPRCRPSGRRAEERIRCGCW